MSSFQLSENDQVDDFASWLESQGHNVARKSLTEKEAREEIISGAYQGSLLVSDTTEELPIVLADQKSGAGYYAGSLAETFFRYHRRLSC